MTVQTWSNVPSRSLGMRSTLTVVTPEGRGVEPVAWPGRPGGDEPGLAILLHGLSGNNAVWAVRNDLRAVANQFNLVLALPDGARSFWLNQAVGLKYGDWVGEELPQILRQTLRVSTRREDTFIGGFSMGGYGAMRAAFDHPDVFAGAFALSGTLDVAEEAFRGRHPDLYQAGFGDPAAPRFEDNLIARLAALRADATSGSAATGTAGPTGDEARPASSTTTGQEAAAESPHEDLRDVKLFAVCGDKDRLLEQNRTFACSSRDAGLDLTYREGPGAHTFEFWNHWLPKALSSMRGQ